VKQLVDGVQTETDASTWQARREISLATVVMLALGGLTFIGSVLFVWLYVGRNILRRIGNLQRSMQLLSGGDLESEIFRSNQRDEVAAMADSLEVFRESMIKARALSADQDKDRMAKPNAPPAWRPGLSNLKQPSAARWMACRNPPIRCRPRRNGCRRPPINPARW